MSSRKTARLAWCLWAASLVLTVLGLLFLITSRSRTGAPIYDYWLKHRDSDWFLHGGSCDHPPPSPPESCGLALLHDRLDRRRSPLRRRVRHRHTSSGAGLLAEHVARRRDAGLDLLLGVGFARGAFRVLGLAVPRRTTAFIPLAPLGVG